MVLSPAGIVKSTSKVSENNTALFFGASKVNRIEIKKNSIIVFHEMSFTTTAIDSILILKFAILFKNTYFVVLIKIRNKINVFNSLEEKFYSVHVTKHTACPYLISLSTYNFKFNSFIHRFQII